MQETQASAVSQLEQQTRSWRCPTFLPNTDPLGTYELHQLPGATRKQESSLNGQQLVIIRIHTSSFPWLFSLRISQPVWLFRVRGTPRSRRHHSSRPAPRCSRTRRPVTATEPIPEALESVFSSPISFSVKHWLLRWSNEWNVLMQMK